MTQFPCNDRLKLRKYGVKRLNDPLPRMLRVGTWVPIGRVMKTTSLSSGLRWSRPRGWRIALLEGCWWQWTCSLLRVSSLEGSTLWSKPCFELIGALVTTLVKIDEVTTERDVLEYARLHVSIPVGEAVNMVKSVKINDTLCQVFLEEEFCIPDHFLGSFFEKWGVTSEAESKV